MDSQIREKIESRPEFNKKIIELLERVLVDGELTDCRALRFNQLMYILNGTEDFFNEEPTDTYRRFKKTLKITE